MINSKGYLSLVSSVKHDTDENGGIFNPNGCEEKCQGSNCFHQYCDKFKWIIDRAKYYSEVLEIDAITILDKWETDRNYWYMNYYQESNQPSLEGRNIRIFDTLDDFKKSGIEKGFRCPHCNGISTHPTICNSGLKVKRKVCNWKAFGLFGCLGKGTFVFIKSRIESQTIFTPVAWESKEGDGL